MTMFKRIVCLAFVICIAAVFAVSCGPKALGMYPTYVGGEVTSTDHEFTKDDFYVIVAFDDGSDRVVEDFEIGEITREGGNYIINIKYQDVSYPVYVPIHVHVYPSEMDGAE